MWDDKFTTPSGIVILHPSVGTHWVMYTNKNCFDSYGCPPPLNLMSFLNNGCYSDIKFRKMIVIVQHIVYMCCISQI